MIKEFQFRFDELNIVTADLTLLLGFEDGVIPEPFPEIIAQALNDAPLFCNIQGGYKTFDSIEINTESDLISIDNKTFSPGKIVTTQLKNMTAAAIVVCTAGEGISNHANKILNEGDPLLSYVFDVIGSVTVEKTMDKIQELLEVEVQKSDLHISDHYSPGYCDWSVSEQQHLFNLLPENFCEVSLSESSLMNPIKSLSGIIGIGKKLKQKGYQCHWCDDTDCIYGKIKRQVNR